MVIAASVLSNFGLFLKLLPIRLSLQTLMTKTLTMTTTTALMANEDGRNASEQERNEEERERWPLVPVPVFAYTQKYFEHRNNQFKKRYIASERLLRHLCRLFEMTITATSLTTTTSVLF